MNNNSATAGRPATAAEPDQTISVEHALLGLLSVKPMHGYEIHGKLSGPAGLGLVWRVKQAHLYAILSRLEEKGYVSVTVLPQEGRPSRKVFHLTESGRQVYRAWLESPIMHAREFRLEFLAKLYCARLEGDDEVRNLISIQRTACLDWMEREDALAKEPEFAEEHEQRSVYDGLVHEFRLGQIEAMITWLEECGRRTMEVHE